MSDAIPRASRAGATLLLIATFTLGMIAGAASLHIARFAVGPPPGPPPPPGGRLGAVLERELGLDADQAARVREILADSRERMRDEVEASRKRIRELLTPEQRERFDTMGPRDPMHPLPPPPRRPGRRHRGPEPPDR